MSDKILYSLESFSLLNFCVEFTFLSYKTGSISKLGPAFIIAHSFEACCKLNLMEERWKEWVLANFLIEFLYFY